jgi:phosphohistidine phosphatase
MDLIFWRHAEAEDGSASGRDADRVLSKRGRKQAAKMAKWLSQHLPADTQVLCSPASRCLQTATALHDLHDIEIKVADFLSVESTAERIAQEIAKAAPVKALLIVGHQPNLGLLISRLAGLEQHACVVKKGSVWWLAQRSVEGVVQYYIYTIQQPDL